MAYSLIAHTAKQSPDSNGFTTSAINTTGADLIVLWLLSYNGVARPTISDLVGGNSNTWTALTDRGNGSLTRGTFFYCVPTHVGSGHTFTVGGSGNFSSIYVEAWSGCLTSGPFDQQNGGSNSGTTVQPGSVTPGSANELVVTGCGNYDVPGGSPSPPSADSGFSVSDSFLTTANSMSGGMAYLVQTTATAENPTWTFAQAAAQLAAIATFKPAGGGGGVSIGGMSSATRGVLGTGTY